MAPHVKQRVFDGAETPAKQLILNGLLKRVQSRHLCFGPCLLGTKTGVELRPDPGRLSKSSTAAFSWLQV
jgi:hypothetical protein